jgi:hypothetical protein
MLDEYEFYQGVILRQLIVESQFSLNVRPHAREGRINSFILNGRIGLYVKHSTKRMSPWRFTFTIEQAADLLDLEAKFPESFVVLVCETDGLVSLDMISLHRIVSFQESENGWVRVERPPRTQYDVAGNRGELDNKVAKGLGPILDALRPKVRERNGLAG